MRIGVIYAVTAGLLWGLTYPMTKLALTVCMNDHVTVTTGLYLMLTIYHIPVLMLSRSLKVTKTLALFSIVLGLINYACMYLISIIFNYMNVGIAAFLVSTYPIFIFIIEHLRHGKVSTSLIINILLTMLGLYMISTPTTQSCSMPYIALALLCSLLYAIYVIIYNSLCSKNNVITVNAFQAFSTLIVSIIASSFLGNLFIRFVIIRAHLVLYTMFALVCIVPYLLEASSHKYLTASQVAIALSVESVSALVITDIVTCSIPSINEILGSGFILSSVVMLNHSASKIR